MYHLKTVYLITKSDLKTTLLPATVFALTAVFSGPLLTTTSTLSLSLTPESCTNATPILPPLLSRLFKSITWTWLNLWVFNLANQRLPDSILEDSLNKPWRAIPSGRLSPSSARHLLLASLPLVYLSTLHLGGRTESLVLMVLTWMYNDLGAADENFLLRHACNALGFVVFGAGAAGVACGDRAGLNPAAWKWLAVIAVTITCTIQFQDMEDQEGDRERERRTVPIVLGDGVARRVNAGAVVAASAMCALFWGLRPRACVLPVAFGGVIALRTYFWRSVKADRVTFKLWCLWLVGLYLLPLVRVLSGEEES